MDNEKIQEINTYIQEQISSSMGFIGDYNKSDYIDAIRQLLNVCEQKGFAPLKISVSEGYVNLEYRTTSDVILL